MTEPRPLTDAVDELVRTVDALVAHLPPDEVAPFRAAVSHFVEELLSAATVLAAQSVLSVVDRVKDLEARVETLEQSHDEPA